MTTVLIRSDHRLTYNVPEAAAILGVAASTLYEQLKQVNCEIPHHRIGHRVVISRAELAAYLGCATEDLPVGYRKGGSHDRKPVSR